MTFAVARAEAQHRAGRKRVSAPRSGSMLLVGATLTACQAAPGPPAGAAFVPAYKKHPRRRGGRVRDDRTQEVHSCCTRYC